MTRRRPRQSSPSPYWANPSIPGQFDLAVLKPATLASGQRFETLKDVRARRKRLRAALTTSSIKAVRYFLEEIGACDDVEPCGQPYCPSCARQFRRWTCAQLLKLAEKHPRANKSIVTVNLGHFSGGTLRSADPAKAASALRKRLSRSWMDGATVAGGIEVAWHQADRKWRLHAHLLVIGVEPEAIESIRRGEGDLEIDEFRDPAKQLSYLLKFLTGHRPIEQTGPKKSPLFPLPRQRLIELISWASKFGPSEFLFLYGVRRSGRNLVLTRRQNARSAARPTAPARLRRRKRKVL
ncbi:MAG: hypothetical protein JO108_17760 [Acidobacteriaceae bacterium]|nr:hypothetical protein [Acidobacteriaceae bacterium]